LGKSVSCHMPQSDPGRAVPCRPLPLASRPPAPLALHAFTAKAGSRPGYKRARCAPSARCQSRRTASWVPSWRHECGLHRVSLSTCTHDLEAAPSPPLGPTRPPRPARCSGRVAPTPDSEAAAAAAVRARRSHPPLLQPQKGHRWAPGHLPVVPWPNPGAASPTAQGPNCRAPFLFRGLGAN
jgi:hypothetical protein